MNRHIALIGWIAAWTGVVLAPVHALARFATEQGKIDLESGVVRAWAEPAAERLRILLDWSDPDTVYLTYGKVWFPIFVAAGLCAVAAYRARTPAGFEKAAWIVSLAGLGLSTLAVFGDYYTPWIDQSFTFLGMPGLLLGVLGGLPLGVLWLRRGLRPKITGWLLVLWIPLFVLLSSVIAMGAAFLPVIFAWASAARRAGQ
ncbi:hypothetical protein [Herbidospora sp. RD11066]